jgi:hypothetical protein
VTAPPFSEPIRALLRERAISEEVAARVAGVREIRILTREAAWPKPSWAALIEAAVTEGRRIGAVLLVMVLGRLPLGAPWGRLRRFRASLAASSSGLTYRGRERGAGACAATRWSGSGSGAAIRLTWTLGCV